jgi:hypothetical protein
MLRTFLLTLVTALFAGTALAADMEPTIYSDGVACPAQCDAHVVFHKSHNGTANAFAPSSTRASPEPCMKGEACRICFHAADASCLTAVYRGAGPPKLRFDFTPAFFDAQCAEPDLPKILADMCKSFGRTFDRFTEDAVYCLAEPTAKGCAALMAAAEARKAEDKVLFDDCKALGEENFNKKHRTEKALQRSDSCTYEKFGTGGPNSHGVTWRRLLPAACQTGAFVGRDGLDCCDKNKMSLGGLGKECSPYLAKK